MGGSVEVRSAVRGGISEGVGFGWQQCWRQLRRRSRSWQRLLVSARELTLGTASGEGVGIGESVRKGVDVKYDRGGSVTCVVSSRGSTVTCVAGGSDVVGGV